MLFLFFNKIISKLRKKINQNRKKFFTTISLLNIFFFVFAFLLDRFLDWSILSNFIRAIIAVPFSILIFVEIYGFLFVLNKLESSIFGNEFKENLSFNQRINITFIVVILVFIFNFIFIRPGLGIYTFVTSLFLCVIYFGILFLRPIRNEYKEAEYGFNDIRDIEHEIEVNKAKNFLLKEDEKGE